MLGHILYLNDNKDYEYTLPEIKTMEEISTALLNEESGYIYVCYNDGSCVNVFDENGKFLWAVSVPYLRNSYFEITDDNLVVYNGTDAYLYDCNTGKFISKSSSDSLDLSFCWEDTYVSEDDFERGEIYFNTYDVFKIADDGSYFYIVQKPIWYNIFNFSLDWLVSFIGAISLGIMLFINKTIEYRNANKEKISNQMLLKVLKYIKKIVYINIAYLVLNIITGVLLQGILCIGIIPITIHFMASMMIISSKKLGSLSKYEQATYDYWIICSLASFLCAFLSVVLVIFLAG